MRDLPPRSAERLLERSLPPTHAAEAAVGDLAEEFGERAAADGRGRATLWYWRQVWSLGLRSLWAERGRRGGGVEMRAILSDVRHAIRALRNNPGFAAVVVLTLGLGIGANSAIFSVVHGVLLKPLPYAEEDRLVYIRQPVEGLSQANISFSVHDIEDLRARTRALETVAEYHSMSFTLLGRGDAEEVRTGVVSAHFFDLMGIRPILGRDFAESDDRLDAEPVLLMSYGYWQRRFGGDPGIVGEAFEMNGKMHTVIGVLPPVPQHPRENDVYMPTSACPIRSSAAFRQNRSARMMAVFGRMPPTASLQSARSDLAGIMQQLSEEHPDAYATDRGQRFVATPLKEELVQNARPTLLILLGTAGLVLLIACANVANLALARMSKRTQEMAVRTAMGARRTRLAQQLLTEHTVLAVAGGLVGLLIAWLGTDLLVAFAGRFTPRAAETSMNLPVLGFTMAVSVLTGLLFGAAPAIRAGRSASEHLHDGRGTSGGRRSNRLQAGLVVAQLALSFTLLAGSGLLLRSFYLLQRQDPGYDAENVLSMRVVVNDRNSDMTFEERRDFFLTLVDRLRALPGVTSAALTDVSPMQFQQGMFHGVRAEGVGETDGTRLPQAQPRAAGVGYFETAGIPLLAGRTFDPTDDLRSERVAIVNESLAEAVWPGQNPIGRRYAPCNMVGQCGDDLYTVVGLVADVHELGLETTPPAQSYLPVRQVGAGSNIVVRTETDPLAIGQRAREVAKELNPRLPVANMTTFEQIRDDSLAPRRLTLTLLSIFAAVALAVSLAGIAGVIAIGVSQRTHEIGIHMALGARSDTVMRTILGRGMVMVVLGLGLGLTGSVGMARLISGLLWGIPTLDPLTLALTAGVFGLMGMLACYLPGRRATRIDPVVAFRV